MNNLKYGDESHHRLSSFLYEEGLLEITQITSINKHVYYIRTVDDSAFILKKHRHQKTVLQQWNFFEQLPIKAAVPFVTFPNDKKIIDDGSFYWTISPFIEGRKLNYNDDKDRQAAVTTVKDFHASSENIHLAHRVRKPMTVVRWYHRLQSFKQTELMFNEFGFSHLYNDIVHIATTYLRQLTKFPWSMYETKARVHGTWIHGDVASHNFIHKEEKTYLIDFDLLTCTTQIYDYIQLGQRFLPYIHWDLDQLLAYQMVEDAYIDQWLFAICIPTDVMREWMYVVARNPVRSPKTYLLKMEEEWAQRKLFLRNVQSMLKLVYL
ncbi:MAG TPA: phosphotransferase [Bacillota bacterium]